MHEIKQKMSVKSLLKNKYKKYLMQVTVEIYTIVRTDKKSRRLIFLIGTLNAIYKGKQKSLQAYNHNHTTK